VSLIGTGEEPWRRLGERGSYGGEAGVRLRVDAHARAVAADAPDIRSPRVVDRGRSVIVAETRVGYPLRRLASEI
jgi:hypothetical protein